MEMNKIESWHITIVLFMYSLKFQLYTENFLSYIKEMNVNNSHTDKSQ